LKVIFLNKTIIEHFFSVFNLM